MPLQCPFTPPGLKGLNRQRQPRNCRPTLKSKKSQPQSSRNYDEELRQYLATTSQQVPDVGDASAGILNSSMSMPYSKDFGTFDLTICQTEEKRCVVLVKYEGRVFINGMQVYMQQDGRVCDSRGNHDPVFQNYYDCAWRTRRRIRRKQTLQEEDVYQADQRSSPTVDRNQRSDTDEESAVDLLNDEPEDRWHNQERTNGNNQPSIEEIADSRFSPRELQDVEVQFSHIITRLCKLILSVSDRENTDTESAHSEGDVSPDQQQLLKEALWRLSYQYQSAVQLGTNLYDTYDEIPGLTDAGEHVDNESSEMPSLPSAGFPSNGMATSVSGTTFTGSASSVVNFHGKSADARHLRQTTSDAPAWIHDGKSLKNEKDRLYSELVAARSGLRRVQRHHEELQVQYDQVQRNRDELHELLVGKQRFEQSELSDCKSQESGRMQKDEDVNKDSVVPDVLALEDTDQSLAENIVKSIISKSTNTNTLTNEGMKSDRTRGTGLSSTQNSQANKSGPLKSDMKRLRHYADDLKEDMEQMSQENVSLRMRMIKIERDRKDLKVQLRTAESRSEEAKTAMSRLDKKNAELEIKCQHLEREKTTGKLENDRSSSILSDLKSRYRTLERDIGELNKTVKVLEAEKQQQRDDLDQQEQAHLESNNKCIKLTKDNRDLQEGLSQLKRDNSSMEAEIGQLREEIEANATALKQEEASRKVALNELHELQRSHAELDGQNVHLRATATSAESFCNVLKKKNEELEQKMQDMETQNETLEIRTRNLSNTGRLLEVENSELKRMLRRLRSDNAEMKIKTATLTKANADFRSKVEHWERESASTEGKIRNFVRTIASNAASLESDAKSRVARMASECAELKELQRSKTPLVVMDSTDTCYADVSCASSLALDLQDRDDDDADVLKM